MEVGEVVDRTNREGDVGICSAYSSYCSHFYGKRFRRCAFGLIHSPEDMPKLKRLHRSMDSRIRCRARLSFSTAGVH